VRASTSGKTIHYTGASSSIAIGEHNGDTFTPDISPGVFAQIQLRHDDLVIAPDGLRMLSRNGVSNPIKSSDGGFSWSLIGSLPAATGFYFAYAGGIGSDSRWVGASSYLRYSENFGTSWVDKQGNLPAISPLYHLDVVKILEY
jgi:hypothetical protein